MWQMHPQCSDSEHAKFLYLLPSHHDYTTLFIRNAHISLLHADSSKKTSGRLYSMPDPPPLLKGVSQVHPFQLTLLGHCMCRPQEVRARHTYAYSHVLSDNQNCHRLDWIAFSRHSEDLWEEVSYLNC